MSLLELRGVEAGYGASQVLFGIDLALGEGEVATLLGRNGMGKTTTLRALFGLIPLKSGEIRFAGERLNGRPTDAIARLGIALVPEGRHIFPNLTVRENLEAFAENRSGAAGAVDHGARPRTLSGPRRAPGRDGQPVVGRRAADARDRTRADDQSTPADPR